MEQVSIYVQSIAHWIFAVKYFEVALTYKILQGMITDADQIYAKRLQIKCALIIVNLVFYAWLITDIALEIRQSSEENTVMNELLYVGLCMASLLLIYSILRIICLVKIQREPGLSTREILIALHTVIFSLIVVIYILLGWSRQFQTD